MRPIIGEQDQEALRAVLRDGGKRQAELAVPAGLGRQPTGGIPHLGAEDAFALALDRNHAHHADRDQLRRLARVRRRLSLPSHAQTLATLYRIPLRMLLMTACVQNN